MYIMIENNISFRLLSELYSLLLSNYYIFYCSSIKRKFPSPLGVIFSLIDAYLGLQLIKGAFQGFRLLSELYSLLSSLVVKCDLWGVEFPSPLGVIFSLILKEKVLKLRF